jgi:prophage tail gpP-like protein
MALQNQNLTATIVSGGQVFPSWESVEISREHNASWSFMKFRASEATDNGAVPISLDTGDLADGYLNGVKVLSGFVMARQVIADKQTHMVEITVAAYPQSCDAGSVIGRPGQYLGQTVQQIASSAAGIAGVNVRLVGELSGTGIAFPRISEHPGERIIDFIGRLCNWRNLHLTDDADGNLCLVRGQSGGQSVATLQEGRNVELFRMTKNYQYGVDPLIFLSQQPGTDATNGTAASQNAITKSNPSYDAGPRRPMVILGDNVGGKQEITMALNQAQNNLNLMMWEIVAVCPGWLADDGQLWILKCFPQVTPITIFSPMLQPKAPLINNLVVRAIKHTQDNQLGTRTEITCCLAAALGEQALTKADSGAPFGAGSTVFANVPTIPATNAPGGPGTAR